MRRAGAVALNTFTKKLARQSLYNLVFFLRAMMEAASSRAKSRPGSKSGDQEFG